MVYLVRFYPDSISHKLNAFNSVTNVTIFYNLSKCFAKVIRVIRCHSFYSYLLFKNGSSPNWVGRL